MRQQIKLYNVHHLPRRASHNQLVALYEKLPSPSWSYMWVNTTTPSCNKLPSLLQEHLVVLISQTT